MSLRPTLLTAAAAASVAACAQATAPGEAPASRPVSAEVAACEVKVRFGSFASGIDRDAFTAIQDALSADERVAAVDVRTWGREGERDLCVALRRPADAAAVAALVQGAVPQRKLNGYVDIEVAGERVFTTQRST